MNSFLFDLDGTLIDSLEDMAAAANGALKLLGYPPRPVQNFKIYVGDGVPKLMERILPEGEATPARIARLREVYVARYLECCTDQTRPYPGVPEVLQNLRGKGCRLAVVSNKPHDQTLRIIEKLFGGGLFDAVLGNREGYPVKPDPALTLLAVEKLGAIPGDCCFVGDSGVDMRTAEAAGMTGVGVLWGFRGEEELRQNGADHLISAPEELLKFL